MAKRTGRKKRAECIARAIINRDLGQNPIALHADLDIDKSRMIPCINVSWSFREGIISHGKLLYESGWEWAKHPNLNAVAQPLPVHEDSQ